MARLDVEEENVRLNEAIHCLVSAGKELMAAWRRCDDTYTEENYQELINCRDRFEVGIATWDTGPKKWR